VGVVDCQWFELSLLGSPVERQVITTVPSMICTWFTELSVVPSQDAGVLIIYDFMLLGSLLIS
jgi:hypothetical protein